MDNELDLIAGNSDLKKAHALCYKISIGFRRKTLENFFNLLISGNIHTLFFFNYTWLGKEHMINQNDKKVADEVAEMLSSLSLLKQIRSLGICKCGEITNTVFSKLINSTNIEELSHLTLDITSVSKFDGIQAIQDMLNSPWTKNITTLNLKGFHLNQDYIQLLEKCLS